MMKATLGDSLPSVSTLNQDLSGLTTNLSFPDPVSTPVDAKAALRRSLKASTLDGVFATIFSNIAGGVLLSNFLVELGASPTQIGFLSSIPMLANLLQPIGAVMGDRTDSRHNYCLWIYGPSRLLWLVLVAGIALTDWHHHDPERLVQCTLAILCITHFVGALGSASWLSWLAALVPRRLRGRYFGLRNSAASLTNLVCVPLLGFVVSKFPSGSIPGFGVLLLFGIIAGLISLGFQFFMVDVNPQTQHSVSGRSESARSNLEILENKPEPNHPELWVKAAEPLAEQTQETQLHPSSPLASPTIETPSQPSDPPRSFLHDTNFLFFLVYLCVWMFAVNLSGPFFNLYLLDNLALDVSWVTVYNSLQAGANLLMLVVWGRLADRIGNRTILLGVGILVAVTPLFWLGTSTNAVSVWLWLPLLHILAGGTWAAIDLCNNNLQLGVAPVRNQSSYFAIAAAVAGVSGALGTTAGGCLAEYAHVGGIPGLFALSGVVRLFALLPLVLVQEQRGPSLRQILQRLWPTSKVPETPKGV